MATSDSSLIGIKCWLKLQSNLKEGAKTENKKAKTPLLLTVPWWTGYRAATCSHLACRCLARARAQALEWEHGMARAGKAQGRLSNRLITKAGETASSSSDHPLPPGAEFTSLVLWGLLLGRDTLTAQKGLGVITAPAADFGGPESQQASSQLLWASE